MSGSRENAVATPPWELEEGPGLSTYSAQGGACSEQQDPPARPKTLGWGVALQPEPEMGSPGSDSGGFSRGHLVWFCDERSFKVALE